MKRYLGALLCVVGTAACSTNKPAETPAETAHNDATPPMAASGDGTPASDLGNESVNTRAEPTNAEPTKATKGSPASASTGATAAATAHEPPPATDYKTNDASVPPDNTKVNKRDTKATAPTPLEQGEGKTDLDITKRIRQAVVGDHSLSFTAKNVKIITREGKVTLRGPVSTNEERSAIQAAAEKVAGASNVDNQLEVKE